MRRRRDGRSSAPTGETQRQLELLDKRPARDAAPAKGAMDEEAERGHGVLRFEAAEEGDLDALDDEFLRGDQVFEARVFRFEKRPPPLHDVALERRLAVDQRGLQTGPGSW